MSAKLINPTDRMDVSTVSMLIYGPPGAWKTSLSQTTANPLTLDFDVGAHRAFNRRAVMRFDAWQDVADAKDEIGRHQTVVVDTVGRLLDLLAQDIVANNSKHGSAFAGLSLQGFGVLKARFAQWVSQLRLAGKDLVFIAHEKEEKDGDNRLVRPDITGGSYTEVMKFTDMVGYLRIWQGRRILDFNPTDQYVGKNAAGCKPFTVPDLKTSPHFLAELIEQAKLVIGQTSETSAKLAQAVEGWREGIAALNGPESFTQALEEIRGLEPKVLKVQVEEMFRTAVHKAGLKWDKASNGFVPANGQTVGAA